MSREATDTRLRGHWLTLARATWVLLAALALTVFAVSVPARFHELLAVASGTERVGWQLRFTVSVEAQYVPLQLSLVEETMQPAYVSLWLRSSDREGKR